MIEIIKERWRQKKWRTTKGVGVSIIPKRLLRMNNTLLMKWKGRPGEDEEAEEDYITAVVEGGLINSDTRVEGMQDVSDEEVEGEDFFEEIDDFYPGNQQQCLPEEELPQSEQAESDSYEPAPQAAVLEDRATHFSRYTASEDDYLEQDMNCDQERVEDEQEVVGLDESLLAVASHNLGSLVEDPATPHDHADKGQSDSAEADQEEFNQSLCDHGYQNELLAAEFSAQEEQENETLDLNNESTKENKYINVVYPNVNRFPEPTVSTSKSDSTCESAQQLASNQEEDPQKTVRPKSPKRAGRPGPRVTAATHVSTTAQSQRGVAPPQATATQPRDAQSSKPPVSTEQSTSRTQRSPTRRVPARQQPGAHTCTTTKPYHP